jgi:hypothetical protein
MSYVLIKKGSYRNKPVENIIFPLIKNMTSGKKGMFLTVDGSKVFGPDFNKIRVTVKPTGFSFVEDEADYLKQCETLGMNEGQKEGEFSSQVSDEKRIKEITERFEILNEMAASLKNGDIRALIVTGPPGVGKSYGVEQTLDEHSLFDDIGGGKRKYEVVKGAMTALGLYAKLYEYSDSGNVIVFDDCDSVLLDDLALNILKAALDSGKRRRLMWSADSSKLRAEGIPNEFEFKGSACFVTNIKFEHVKSKKLKDHLEALMSRCHYLDLTLDTMRDKFLRIKQIADKGDLFEGYGFTKEDEEEILAFIYENRNRLREMSLRTALKVGDLKKISEKWQSLAVSTCMKRAA